jgi:hypothetical protein
LSRTKEIDFFNVYFSKGRDFYLSFFKHCNPQSLIGEASQNLMVSPEAPERMYDFNPDFRLIFMLRDPAERALSDYRRRGQVTGIDESPADLIRTIEQDGGVRSYLIDKGLYFKHISRFLEHFPQDHIYIVIFEEFAADAKRELKGACRFLGIDPEFKFSKRKVTRNPAKPPLSHGLQRLIYKRLRRVRLDDPLPDRIVLNVFWRPLNYLNHLFSRKRAVVMGSGVRRYLIETYFKKDISCLEALLEKDLSSWKRY